MIEVVLNDVGSGTSVVLARSFDLSFLKEAGGVYLKQSQYSE